MEPEQKRDKSDLKQILQKYLFPITIISSVLISGSIGYTVSQVAANNNVSDSAEIDTMKNQVSEARDNSLKVIETEIPKIISDVEKYNEDIDLVSEKIGWLKENVAPIREATDNYDRVVTTFVEVGDFVNVPGASKISDEVAFAQDRFNEIDSILHSMENLTVIQQEMNDSHQKLNSLYKEYQQEKSIEQLLLIEQELNSNVIYQIEDLKKITTEAPEAFELSSSILIAVNNAKSSLISIQETGKNTLQAIQFWKDNEGHTEIGANTEEEFKQNLAASKEKMQNLPDELAQRSEDTVTSINNVQKELQTVRIAEMIISE